MEALLERNIVGGVSGNQRVGCDAIVVSRQAPALRERDEFEWLMYTASINQRALALFKSWQTQSVVRVFRSSKLKNPFAPVAKAKNCCSFRYDGVYKVSNVWTEDGTPSTQEKPRGPGLTTFLLKRMDSQNKFSTLKFLRKFIPDYNLQKKLSAPPLMIQSIANKNETASINKSDSFKQKLINKNFSKETIPFKKNHDVKRSFSGTVKAPSIPRKFVMEGIKASKGVSTRALKKLMVTGNSKKSFTLKVKIPSIGMAFTSSGLKET